MLNPFLGLKEQNNFYTELMPKLQSVLEDAKEFLHPYEAMVDQCREKLGSSTAEKLCKRKSSKNKLKEARKKRQKAATCTKTINMDEEEINPKRDSKEGGQQEDEDEWTDCDTI